MLKNHASYRLVFTLLVLGVLALSACQPGAGTQVATDPEKIAVDPDTPSYPPPQPMPEDFGEPVEVIAGQVTVSLTRSGFSQGDAIELTIANGLDQTIYTEDMKTACSIAILEVQDSDTWGPLLDCGMERLPLTLAIDSGMGRVVTIDPSGMVGAMAGESSPAPGTYRIRFSYRTEPGPEGEEPHSVLSDEFMVSR